MFIANAIDFVILFSVMTTYLWIDISILPYLQILFVMVATVNFLRFILVKKIIIVGLPFLVSIHYY